MKLKIHIVQKGDTLWEIAKNYGVDFEELKATNPQLSSPDMIMPGMKIKIPSSSKPVKKKEEKVDHSKKHQSHQPISMLKEDDKQKPKELKMEMPTQPYPMMQLPELDQGFPTMPLPEVQLQPKSKTEVKKEAPKKEEMHKQDMFKKPKEEIPKMPFHPQEQMPNHPQFQPMPMMPMCCCQHIRPPCCHPCSHMMHNHMSHGCGCSSFPQQQMMPYEAQNQMPQMPNQMQMQQPMAMPEHPMMPQQMGYDPTMSMMEMEGPPPPMAGQQHGHHPMMMRAPNENRNHGLNFHAQIEGQNQYTEDPEMYPSNMTNYYPTPPNYPASPVQNHPDSDTDKK